MREMTSCMCVFVCVCARASAFACVCVCRFIEDYIDSLSTLPNDLKRHFELMRELDKDVRTQQHTRVCTPHTCVFVVEISRIKRHTSYKARTLCSPHVLRVPHLKYAWPLCARVCVKAFTTGKELTDMEKKVITDLKRKFRQGV